MNLIFQQEGLDPPTQITVTQDTLLQLLVELSTMEFVPGDSHLSKGNLVIHGVKIKPPEL
jgi:hypothetical protein